MMPGPWSATVSTASLPTRRMPTLTVEPTGLYLVALSIRLSIIETRLSRSPAISTGSSVTSSISTSRTCASADSAASRSCSRSSSRSGPGAEAWALLRMSRSSWPTSRSARALLLSTRANSSCWRSVGMCCVSSDCSASTFTRIAAMGVRSSCAASAMKLCSRAMLARSRSMSALKLCTSGSSSSCRGRAVTGARSCGPREAISRATLRQGRSASRIDSHAGSSRKGTLMISGRT